MRCLMSNGEEIEECKKNGLEDHSTVQETNLGEIGNDEKMEVSQGG